MRYRHGFIAACLLLCFTTGCVKETTTEEVGKEEPIAESVEKEETVADGVGEEYEVNDLFIQFIAGDRELLENNQEENWWIPEFDNDVLDYEFLYFDLDGDNQNEMLVRLADDPSGYNGVFHIAGEKILCWNSDDVEMSCWDYPLTDKNMVRQYDYNGSTLYTIYKYNSQGEMETLHEMFIWEESFIEDENLVLPSYLIDGEEVTKEVFFDNYKMLIEDKLVSDNEWKTRANFIDDVELTLME